MPEIGATLREARMRAQVDIAEVEVETKIRAKYLRALENEEWDLLPGPTYVKTFLRTYAEALDLDAKVLVEEYKARHERLSDVELQPISPRPGRERRRRNGPLVPRGLVVVLVLGGLFGALFALGQSGDEGGARRQPKVTFPPDDTGTGGSSADSGGRSSAPERRSARRVRLQLLATGPVYVCLKAGARTLVDGVQLEAGERTETFRSRRFRLRLGNSNVRLRINGQLRDVPPSSDIIGLEITPRRGRRPLTGDAIPSCA